MKRIYTLLFCAAALGFPAQVPDWAWARSPGSGDIDEAASIAADAAGNIYVTGYFTGSVATVGTVSLNNSAAGSKEFFIAKYSRAGAVLWAKAAAGSDDDEGISVAVDGSGNVYVCGNFESTTLAFGSSVITNSSNPGQSDVFLVKYNAAGTVVWAQGFGGGLQEEAGGIAVDAAGNVCFTGSYYSLSVLFGSYGVVNAGVSDAFVAKFNSSGVAQWAKRIGGGQTDNGNDVGMDNSGNVYVTGDYNSTTVSTFTPALGNSGGFDIFVAKFDASGNVIYGMKYGGSGDENPTALQSVGGGDFFVCGYFESASLVFGSSTITNGVTRSMFLAKFNASGTPQWAQKASGSQNGYPRQLAEEGGNIYMTGTFDQASVVFGSTTLTNGGSLDAFIVKYNGSGNAVWAKSTGAVPLDQSNAIALSGGFVHIAGMYTGTLTLRDNQLTADGATDAFVTKLCLPPDAPLSAGGSTVCQGYPVTLNATTPPGTQPVWFSMATGGNSLYVGSPFAASTGGTFYVASRDTNSGCGMYSSRIQATGVELPAVNPAVSVTGHTLHASGNGSVVAWYDCNATTTITGQTGASYVLTGSGYFAAIMVSAAGCRDTSACNNYSYTPGSGTVVVTPGIGEQQLYAIKLSAYPNPASANFVIRATANTRVEVVNALGMTVQRLTLDESNDRSVSAGPLPPGVYFIVPAGRTGLIRVVVN